MEYEFIHDAITGDAKARFSLEHEVIGPWIEVELGNNNTKLKELFTIIEEVENGHQRDAVIVGHEYSISISQSDVEIYPNASLDEDILPEMLTTEHIHIDDNEGAACGLDDFKTLLISWKNFINTV
jgi:uncharacterized protein YacL (UPF0231 family)